MLAILPRSRPTFYVIGQDANHSLLLRLFDAWSRILKLDVELAALDIRPNAPPVSLRRIAEHVRDDRNVRGAFLISHEAEMLAVARDIFAGLGPYAEICGRVNCLLRRDGRLEGYNREPVAAGMAWRTLVDMWHWRRTGGYVLCLGAGGPGIAVSVYLTTTPDHPRHFLLLDVDQDRLNQVMDLHRRLDTSMRFNYILCGDVGQIDRLIGGLPTGSMVICAIDDDPRWPLTVISEGTLFPQDGLVWNLSDNRYSPLLRHARIQEEARSLKVDDRWYYDVFNWAYTFSYLFDLELTEERFADLEVAAHAMRPSA